jgi:hypothetical protein
VSSIGSELLEKAAGDDTVGKPVSVTVRVITPLVTLKAPAAEMITRN